MGIARLIVSLALLLIGLLWIAQGVGLLGGSAMSGQSFWAVVGVVMIALAGVVAWSGRRVARG
jgi:hypothetical protein